MIVIGIVGGVASGKSVVAQELRRLGAVIVDVDAMGHDVLRDPQVIAAVYDRWGEQVVVDGQISRRKLAKLVFGDAPEATNHLQYLEGLTHPRIGRRIKGRIDEIARSNRDHIVVMDAAVMFKAGWDRYCDKIVFVEAPRQQRMERAGQREWTTEQFRIREDAQLPLDKKRLKAHTVIDNSGDLEQTYQQVRQFWNSLST